MKTTNKVNLPFKTEINQLTAIQAQQSKKFNRPISQQFDFFLFEYQNITNQFNTKHQTDLSKRFELIDFMFNVHMDSFKLPQQFNQLFNRLKIIAAKSALYHTNFFLIPHNPISCYLRTISGYLKQTLKKNNLNEYFLLLDKNIQLLITQHDTDPYIFKIQAEVITHILNPSKTRNKAEEKIESTVKLTAHKHFPKQNISSKTQDNDYLSIAKAMQIGEWLNLKQASTVILVKLIWKAKDNSEFIFVNKEGVKLKQCNLLELASDLENKIITSPSSTKSAKQSNVSFLKTIG